MKNLPLSGLLMGRYRLSKRQVTHLLAECFGITMAASTVVNQQQVISQALTVPVAELDPVVKNEPVCNIDETSWRQRGAAKRPWLWTVVTAQVTLFRIAPSRSSQVARELLGETYGGVQAPTVVVLTPGWNAASCVGAIWCGISRRFSNAAAIRIPRVGI
jgi:transposase